MNYNTEASRRYRRLNPEKVKSYQREYRRKNRIRIQKMRGIARIKNGKKYREYEKIYRRKNRSRIAENRRNFINRHPNYRREEDLKYSRMRYAANPTHCISIVKKYRSCHPDRVRRSKGIALKKHVSGMANYYIRALLRKGTGLSATDIPIEVVELKKQHLILRRAMREDSKRNQESVV